MIMPRDDVTAEYDPAIIFAGVHSSDAALRNASLETLLLHHSKLVEQIARRYRNLGLDWEDLIAEGNLGMIRAAGKFNPHQGVAFPVYARYWIREAMIRALDNKARTIRIPCQTAHRLRVVRRAETRWIAHSGSRPDTGKLEELTGFSTKELNRLRQLDIRTMPIESCDGVGRPIFDPERIADSNQKSPDRVFDQEERNALLDKLIDRLENREGEILRLYYGVGGMQPETHLAISLKVGLSRERVRQIQKQGLERLRMHAHRHAGDLAC